MKKFLLAAALAVSLFGGAQAMDSETLLRDPARYAVIYATGKMRIYADMQTLSAVQTMDYPGSIENMSFTLYAETYKKNADAFDFARNGLVTRIREIKVDLAADRREKHYEMTLSPVAVYDTKGKKSAAEEETKLGVSAKELYYNLARITRLGY